AADGVEQPGASQCPVHAEGGVQQPENCRDPGEGDGHGGGSSGRHCGFSHALLRVSRSIMATGGRRRWSDCGPMLTRLTRKKVSRVTFRWRLTATRTVLMRSWPA